MDKIMIPLRGKVCSFWGRRIANPEFRDRNPAQRGVTIDSNGQIKTE